MKKQNAVSAGKNRDVCQVFGIFAQTFDIFGEIIDRIFIARREFEEDSKSRFSFLCRNRQEGETEDENDCRKRRDLCHVTGSHQQKLFPPGRISKMDLSSAQEAGRSENAVSGIFRFSCKMRFSKSMEPRNAREQKIAAPDKRSYSFRRLTGESHGD